MFNFFKKKVEEPIKKWGLNIRLVDVEYIKKYRNSYIEDKKLKEIFNISKLLEIWCRRLYSWK